MNMRLRVTKTTCLCIATLVVIFLQSQTVSGQEAAERGYIEVGVRVSAGDDKASKYLEYRDIPNGFFVRRFELRLPNLLKNRYFFNLQSRETIEKDQTHLLEVGRYTKFRGQLRWDQTPHYFTNTTSTLFNQSAPGVFTFPLSLRTLLQSAPSTLSTVLKGNAPFDNRMRRHMGLGSFTVTPTSNWTVQAQYSRESALGWRPLGTTTNSFTNAIELPEPIDYRTHLTDVGAEYANKKWVIQFGYSGSLFTNEISTLVWDNPFRTTDAANAGATGRADLYPDNNAHQIRLAFSIKLAKDTRFMGSIVRGWMFQNDSFLPFTINSAIANVPTLPATSLHGEKNTLAMNYTLNSTILRRLPMTIRYRSYDYDNDTPSLTFSDYVRTDGGLGGATRRSLPYAYHRQNLTADVVWEFGKESSMKFAYDWERMERKHRDVERSDEHSVTAALDLIPKEWQKWFLFRMSYRYSDRQPQHYEPNEESFPLGEPGLGQLHELRKFDEAARSRHIAQALLQIDPTDRLSLSASYGTTQDNYNQSLYGLLKDINYNYTFDAGYSINSDFSLFADFTRERFKYNQRSRQRVPATLTAPVNDSTLNDWESDMRDSVDTGEVGVEGTFFQKRVRLESYYVLSVAKGLTRSRALGTPGVPGFLVTTAQDYPNTSNRLHSFVSSFRLKLKENFCPRVEYRFEKYGRTDFQTQVMAPYMGNLDSGLATSIFLGSDNRPYRVHAVTFSLGYQF